MCLIVIRAEDSKEWEHLQQIEDLVETAVKTAEETIVKFVARGGICCGTSLKILLTDLLKATAPCRVRCNDDRWHWIHWRNAPCVALETFENVKWLALDTFGVHMANSVLNATRDVVVAWCQQRAKPTSKFALRQELCSISMSVGMEMSSVELSRFLNSHKKLFGTLPVYDVWWEANGGFAEALAADSNSSSKSSNVDDAELKLVVIGTCIESAFIVPG